MKALDKICVAPHQIFDYDLEIQEVGHNGAEEYIRKDALANWAKERLAIVEELEKMNPAYWPSAHDAYELLIDKLNSL